MYLTSIRLRNVGPFDDVTIPLVDAGGAPRLTTVVLGDSGAGKTTLLAAIAATRPGFVGNPPRMRSDTPPSDSFVVARYRLGDDDPARPHELVVASPNADLHEHPADAAARKREQAHFDRLAAERGFCVIPLSTARWAARVPAGGVSPERPISAMDHRAHATLDDASRADLAREVKQALVNAVTVAALSAYQSTPRPPSVSTAALDDRRTSSMLPPPMPVKEGPPMHDLYRATFHALLPDGEATYEGVDPTSFEPLFRDQAGRIVSFDDLAFGTKNRILMGGVLLRRLSLAYPGKNPLDCEGVALIDEIEAHLPQRRQREIVDILRRAFPRLQLVVTTQSPLVLEQCAHDEVVVLSRDLETGAIAVSGGPAAVLH
jgi:hypothetical protein